MFFVSSFLKWNDTGLWQDPWMHVLHGLALQNDLKRAAAVSTRGEIPILLRDGQSFQSRWIYDKRINMVAACPLLASATRCILTCVCITGIRINHCNTVGKGVCHEYVEYSECTWGMIWTLIKLIYFSKRMEIPMKYMYQTYQTYISNLWNTMFPHQYLTWDFPPRGALCRAHGTEPAWRRATFRKRWYAKEFIGFPMGMQKLHTHIYVHIYIYIYIHIHIYIYIHIYIHTHILVYK